MKSAENLLMQMRTFARQALPQRAFLRRDRGNSLWVSNAPAFDSNISALPGFTVVQKNQLLYLLPDAHWIARWEEEEPQDFFSESLMRFRGMQADTAGLKLFAEGLKLLEGNASPAEVACFEQKLRQRAALALRRAGCGGGLYACALIASQLKNATYKRENAP